MNRMLSGMRASGFVAWITMTLAGFIVWGVHFMGVYSFGAVACARGWSAVSFLGLPLLPLGIFAASLLAIAVILIAYALWSRAWRRFEEEVHGFTRFLTGATAVLSIASILLNTLPALLISPCA